MSINCCSVMQLEILRSTAEIRGFPIDAKVLLKGEIVLFRAAISRFIFRVFRRETENRDFVDDNSS